MQRFFWTVGAMMRSDRSDDFPTTVSFLALNAILVAMVLFGLVLIVGAYNFGVTGGHPGLVAIIGLCGLFVGGAGLALLYRTHFQAGLIAAREAATMRRYPGQPWMLNPDWATGQMSDPQVGRVIFGFIFVAGWIGGIAFVCIVNFDKISAELQTSPAGWAAAAFFVLITAAAINVTIKITRSWLRIGNGLLRFETFPGRIGGQFKAKLETRLRHRPTGGLLAELTCLRQIPAAERGDLGIEEEKLFWKSVPIAPAQMRKAGAGLIVPIVLDIPDGLPESGADGRGGTVNWHLRVSTAGKGDPFLLFAWIVPVFRKT